MNGIGDQFQHETRYEPDRMPRHQLVWETKPDVYKNYPEAQKIELPSFEPSRAMSLDQTLKQRKSVREFQPKSISKGQLSYLLWASTGLQRVEDGYEFRTAPSAGALYPIETYIVANNIRTLEGQLNRVIAYSRLLGEAPTLETAARALENIANKEPITDKITPDFIMSAVAEGFQLKKADLLGRKRDKDTSLARRLAMYLIRQETNYSLAQIGREIGNRDAASVTTACKKIISDIDNSPYIKRKVQDIQRILHHSNNGHK